MKHNNAISHTSKPSGNIKTTGGGEYRTEETSRMKAVYSNKKSKDQHELLDLSGYYKLSNKERLKLLS
jgi:hypothetical protein